MKRTIATLIMMSDQGTLYLTLVLPKLWYKDTYDMI